MNAAHVHLVLNHAPLFGVLGGLVLLIWGILRHSYEVRLVSYAAFIISAMLAVVVYLTGGAAESVIEDLPGITERAIERHEDLAKVALTFITASGIVATVALFAERSTAGFRRSVLTLLFIVALLALGTVGYTANLGGQIRHSEITAQK